MRAVGRLAAALLSSVLLGAAAQASQSLTPEGVWLHSNERIGVRIAPCGERLCGRIVWLRNPNDETGAPRTDFRNPDRAQRTRPFMGMTVISGLVRDGPRTWTDGTIYNPDDGETYSARITVVDSGTMHVRAYELLPLLGKTLVWTRLRE